MAARLRPASWEEVIGQAHLKNPHHPLQRLIRSRKLKSLILCGLPLVEMNATMDGTKEIRPA